MVLALRQISTLRGERFDASRDHVTCMASTEALFFWVSHESTSLGPFGQHHVMKKEKMLDKYRNSEVFMNISQSSDYHFLSPKIRPRSTFTPCCFETLPEPGCSRSEV